MPDVFPQSLLAAIQPGSYSTVDTTALADTPPAVAGRVTGILGDARGGQPNTPLTIYGAQELKQVLRGGALYDCARMALEAGSKPVVVVRIGTGILASTAALAGTGGTAITLTSLVYGAFANAITYTTTASSITLTYVDAVTGVTYKETYTTALTGNAANVDLANQISGKVSGVAKSQLVSAVAGAATTLTVVASATAMTSGSDGSAIAGGDWTTGLTALEVADIDFVVAATGDATVHAQVATHCAAMSAPLVRRERRQILGGVLGETPAQAVARAQAAGLAGTRNQVVYPGVTYFAADGTVKTWDPFYAAAYTAGRHCALPDAATSLMHQLAPGVLGVEREVSRIQGGDLDTLLRGGVTPIARADGGGYWFTDSITTSTDPLWRDFVKQGAADTVSERLRVATEGRFTGRKATGASAGAIALAGAAEAERMLGEQIIRGYLRDQITVSEDPSSPGRFQLVVPVMLVDTTRFIGIVVALQPSATAVAARATA